MNTHNAPTTEEKALQLEMRKEYNTFVNALLFRVEGFAKLLLWMSGGGLSISIGIFVDKDLSTLSIASRDLLSHSWLSLFGSMILILIGLLILIARDYDSAEKWYANKDIPSNFYIEVTLWLLGGLSVGLICFGYYGLAQTAIALIKQPF